jgi:photosystem II stability/assembly factor-like uncharacterized protein
MRRVRWSLALVIAVAGCWWASGAAASGWRDATPPGGAAWAFAASPARPSVVFAVDDAVAFRSDDGGASWRRLGELPWLEPVGHGPYQRLSVDASGRVLWAENAVFVARSVDGGVSWRRVVAATTPAYSLVTPDPVVAGRAWAIDPAGRVIETLDGGNHWRAVSRAPTNGSPRDLVALEGAPCRLLLGTESLTAADDLLRTADCGRHWRRVGLSAPRDGDGGVDQITVDPSRRGRVFARLHAATSGDGTCFTTPVMRSDDYGRHWRLAGRGLPTRCVDLIAAGRHQVIAIAGRRAYTLRPHARWVAAPSLASKLAAALPWLAPVAIGTRTALIVGSWYAPPYRAASPAGSWVLAWTGLNAPVLSKVIAIDAQHAVALSYVGVLVRTANAGLSWQLAGSPGIQDIATIPGQTGSLLELTATGFLARSDDAGTTWRRVGSRVTRDEIGALITVGGDGADVYVIDLDTLWASHDGGLHFTHHPRVDWAYADPTGDQHLYACNHASSDGGATWTLPSPEPAAFDCSITATPTGRILFADFFTAGIYGSDDHGATWQLLDPTGAAPVMSATNTLQYAQAATGTQTGPGGIRISTDGGDHWQASATDTTSIYPAAAAETTLYAFTGCSQIEIPPCSLQALTSGAP